ncbi:NACHT domain-containing protein [Streptomyces bobili]|uniref:NACHT domain-containing protein n=1 Tax=Streptomyces bobili TaxID=67280 RepID=UPI0033A2FDCF
MREWPRWRRSAPATLANYVLPHEVASLAALPGRSGAGRLDRLRHIYQVLRGLDVQYADPDPSARAGVQRLREPFAVLRRPRAASCLDMALTLSAAAQHAGLRAMIVVLDAVGPEQRSHALVAVQVYEDDWPLGDDGPHVHDGVWDRQPEGFAELVASDPTRLNPYVPLVLIDPLGICGGSSTVPTAGLRATFEQAAAQGREYLAGGGWQWSFAVDLGLAWSADSLQEPTISLRKEQHALQRTAEALEMRIAADLTAELGRQDAHLKLSLQVWERGATVGGPPCAGTLDSFVTQFASSTRRRLVLLGEPGSGKSTAARQLTVAMLSRREPNGPVATVVNMSAWDPHSTHLDVWLADRIGAAYYPALRRGGGAHADAPRELVRRRMVLPVLDGLDELPKAVWNRARQELRRVLADERREFVLVCRSEAERELIPGELSASPTSRIVTLAPTGPREAVRFLTETAGLDVHRWQPVFEEISGRTDGPLARTLTAPLMLDLARIAYDVPGSGPPAELCDRTRFPDPDVLRAHLLARYLPSVYRKRGPAPEESENPERRRRPYRLPAAQRWLTFLARHLDRLQTTQFLWWRLPDSVPILRSVAPTRLAVPPVRGTVVLGALLACGPAAIVCAVALVWLLQFVGFVTVTGFHRVFIPYVLPLASPSEEEAELVNSAVGWAEATAQSITVGSAWPALTMLIAPSLLLLGAAWASRRQADRLGPSGSVKAELRNDALTTAAYAGVVSCLVLVAGVITALWLEASRYLPLLNLSDLHIGLVVSLLMALALSLGLASNSAWAHLLEATLWLAPARRMPWRPLRFLEDAHARGVLRRNGSIYEFRHQTLQRHLVLPPQSQRMPVAGTLDQALRLEAGGRPRQAIRLLRPLAMYEPAAREALAALAERRATRAAQHGLLWLPLWIRHFEEAAHWWERKVREGDPGAVEGLAEMHRRTRAACTDGRWRPSDILRMIIRSNREHGFRNAQ